MYNRTEINNLITFINDNNGLGDKEALKELVCRKFDLIDDDPIYYNDYFAIRFCYSSTGSFSGTVISLSKLLHYDDRPFIVCLVTLEDNRLYLANTTLMNKVSHSSQKLSVNRIRGSFNGSNIIKCIDNIMFNEPKYFEELYNFHETFTVQENIERIVENSSKIKPIKSKYCPTETELDYIETSVKRAKEFLRTNNYMILKSELNRRVNSEKKAIIAASFIPNVNLRGRIIEYLITSDDSIKNDLENAVLSGGKIPSFVTKDDLGDFIMEFKNYISATDIKTKILFLSSCPKGYNIDKLLEFLGEPDTVYLIFIVGISVDNRNSNDYELHTELISVFNEKLLDNTRIISHWAGRNSRGVSQWNGKIFDELLDKCDNYIDEYKALMFLNECLKM